ncbi:MAG: drug/metabolite exporter YedA [Chloroflexi bacterium]|nr:drug/metabolite exporter YedA [Chloroflexota bacterium]
MTNAATTAVVGTAGLSSRVRLIGAFAAIYLIWGSTYLAMRFAIETLPPFLMAGVRFLLAGGALYAWMRWRGAPRPAPRQWAAAAVVGALMLFAGNGGVVWAEQRITSSIVALLLAMTPLWMMLLDWLRPRGVRPTRGSAAGMALGLAGIALLIGPDNLISGNHIDLLSAIVVLLAALAWAAGSIYTRHAHLPDSPLLSTSMQMLVGGALLMTTATLTGDWSRMRIDAISLRSILAVAYLVLFGSLIAFSAYIWLLRHAPASRVATYAYVNPVIAVFLGWALASEPLTPQTLIAAAVIIGAVAIIITCQRAQK